MWVPSLDCVSYADVYIVLVCRVSAWFLLHVYVLVDILDFVIVFFQSCAFRVVATRKIFGLCSTLRYRVVSEWCFRIHIIL